MQEGQSQRDRHEDGRNWKEELWGCRQLLTVGGDTHRMELPESTSPAHTSTLALSHSRHSLHSGLEGVGVVGLDSGWV